VGADHGAHAATHGLGRDDDLSRQVKLAGHSPLELGKEQVGNSMGSNEERYQPADKGGEHGPRLAGSLIDLDGKAEHDLRLTLMGKGNLLDDPH